MDRKQDTGKVAMELFELYSDDVYRYARCILGSSVEAEDIVQEVFLRVLRSFDKDREYADIKLWLMRIAKNCVIDTLRKRKRRRTREVSDLFGLDHISDAPVRSFIELEESLQVLKPQQRQVFVLRVIHDLSIHEAARILGWTEGKVRTTLSRAVARLRTEFTGDKEPAIVTKEVD